MLSIHCFLALMALGGTHACPFMYLSVDKNTAQSRVQRNLFSGITSTATNGTSHCKKTHFESIVPTARGICSAHASIHSAMDYLLDTGTLQRSDLYAQAVRLAFHDAGEIDSRNCSDIFGPDGCLSSQGSAGLIEKEAFTNVFIEPIWQSICDRISRADFWTLFGTVAVERAARFAISLTFQYGRHDKTECEGGAGRLPSSQGGLEELERIFVNQMGLTMDDAVTLLGAHSLGHTHVQRSGYGFIDRRFPAEVLNAWDDTPGELDNEYYKKILSQKWTSRPATVANRSQWRHRSEPQIMLNPDMSLAYSINTTLPQRGQPKQTCRPKLNANEMSYKCTHPFSATPTATLPLVQAFAADNTLFLQAFGAAFTKMMAVGYGGVPSPAKDGATSWGKLGTLTVLDRNLCEAR